MLDWQVQAENPFRADHDEEAGEKSLLKTISQLTSSGAFEGGDEQMSREVSNKVRSKRRNQVANGSRKGRDSLQPRQ